MVPIVIPLGCWSIGAFPATRFLIPEVADFGAGGSREVRENAQCFSCGCSNNRFFLENHMPGMFNIGSTDGVRNQALAGLASTILP